MGIPKARSAKAAKIGVTLEKDWQHEVRSSLADPKKLPVAEGVPRQAFLRLGSWCALKRIRP